MSNVVSNLYQILDSIIDALNFDRMNANNQKDRNRAAKLLELLDSKFKLSTMYMADLTYILSILCKTFQKDNISLSEVKNSLDMSIAAITTQFIGIDDQPPTYGINLQKYIQENPYYNHHLPDDFTYFAKVVYKHDFHTMIYITQCEFLIQKNYHLGKVNYFYIE